MCSQPYRTGNKHFDTLYSSEIRANRLFSIEDSIQFSTCIVILPRPMSKRYPCLVSTVYPPIIIEYITKEKEDGSQNKDFSMVRWLKFQYHLALVTRSKAASISLSRHIPVMSMVALRRKIRLGWRTERPTVTHWSMAFLMRSVSATGARRRTYLRQVKRIEIIQR
jgi:hypothetical protein